MKKLILFICDRSHHSSQLRLWHQADLCSQWPWKVKKGTSMTDDPWDLPGIGMRSRHMISVGRQQQNDGSLEKNEDGLKYEEILSAEPGKSSSASLDLLSIEHDKIGW